MEKSKKKGITWSEAAKIVLENASRPLSHKEILQDILDGNLKDVRLTVPQALACVNAMLHANSRSPTDLFHKVEGRTGMYKLNENHYLRESSVSDSEFPSSSSNSGLSDSKEPSQFADNVSDTKSSNPNPEASPFSTFPQANLAASSGSLPPISSMLGSYPARATKTTSVTSSVACAIADSRLNSLIAPTPDNLPPTSALKKRVVKPRFQGEGPTTKKPRVTFKLDKEKKEKPERAARPPVKTKAELKYMEDDAPSSKNFIPPVLKPPMYPTHTVVKTPGSGYFGQKRHKKMSIAAQVKRSKEGLVDLVFPDSILSKINVRTLINHKTFNLLPAHYQYQLVKMLPEVDREIGSRGEFRPTGSAFSNEFFTSAYRSWRERLSEGEFTPEMSQKIQQEQNKLFNQDPWKTKHFEAVWGQKFMENERYVSPVERSHQIMEEVHQEWLKEQERKQKEEEDKKLREASKTNKNTENVEQSGGKNLTAKQKTALLRQQKLANAKGATNKAPPKKTTDGKTTNRGNGSKGASKDSHIKEESTGEKSTKGTEKAKSKQTAKATSKQSKASRPAKVVTSEARTKVTEANAASVTIAIIPTQSGDALATTDKGAAEEKDRTAQENAENQKSLSNNSAAIPAQQTPSTSKSTTKTTKSTKKRSTKSSTKVATNSAVIDKQINFQCFCLLKPMMMCRRCGAFCHSDCISPLSVCTACMAS